MNILELIEQANDDSLSFIRFNRYFLKFNFCLCIMAYIIFLLITHLASSDITTREKFIEINKIQTYF
jgi:hypothetical protein